MQDIATRMSFLASRSARRRKASASPSVAGKIRVSSPAGCYTDDVNLPGQAYASMVRSPHAHAQIVRIDAAAALAAPGVLAVLTGVDLVADGLKAMSHRPVPTNPRSAAQSPDGSTFFVSDPLPLPVDRPLRRRAGRP